MHPTHPGTRDDVDARFLKLACTQLALVCFRGTRIRLIQYNLKGCSEDMHIWVWLFLSRLRELRSHSHDIIKF
jgi:hypothetical protein